MLVLGFFARILAGLRSTEIILTVVAAHITEIMTGIVSCLPYAVTSGIQNFCWMTTLRCNDIYIYIFFFFWEGGGEKATLQILALVTVFKQQIPGVGLLNDHKRP